MQPLISCIIPTFNRERLIGTAIQSFLNQDYENRELVIWDNGFDGTQYLVPRDHRIRYFQSSIEKLRIGDIRNRANALAMGSVIAHFDSDDWSAPGRLSYQMKMMQKSDKGVVGFHSLLFWDGLRASKFRGNDGHACGGSLLYRREFWEKCNFPNSSVGEDAVFVDAARAADEMFSVDGGRHIVARIHADNTSKNMNWDPVSNAEIPKGFFADVIN